MTRRRGYALLAAIVAVIVALSTAIYVGVASDPGTDSPSTLSGYRSHDSAAPASAGSWVGTWSASPAGAEPGTESHGLAGRSVRNVVHTSVGGTSARVTFSNLYGSTSLHLTHASVAVAADTGTAEAAEGTMRRLTFGGATSVVVPAGQQVTSDAARLRVPGDSDLLVTSYSPTGSGPVTYHPNARQTSYASHGDRTEDVTGAPYTEETPYWRYLTSLDVVSREAEGTVVAFGDSLTDGVGSTANTNRRWPDLLSDRLRSSPAKGRDQPRYSVVNEGIGGNRVLTDGLGSPAANQSGVNRFTRDVLDRPNVRVVVIDLGVNDILRSSGDPDTEGILDGLRSLVSQAHARGIKVVGATLMPFGGRRGYSDARESARQQINTEIREGRVYDEVVDFDKAVRDPYAPRRFRPDYDSGDHLHPGDRGYARMAAAFDLTDLKGSAPARL